MSAQLVLLQIARKCTQILQYLAAMHSKHDITIPSITILLPPFGLALLSPDSVAAQAHFMHSSVRT